MLSLGSPSACFTVPETINGETRALRDDGLWVNNISKQLGAQETWGFGSVDLENWTEGSGYEA